MFANTKFNFLIVPDVAARDAILKRLTLIPALPEICRNCKQRVPEMYEHVVGCVYRRANRTAGGMIERAIFSGISRLESGATRTPRVTDHPLFEVLSPNHKKEADILSFHRGINVLIDSTFSTKPASSLDASLNPRGAANAAQTRKLSEYSAHLSFPSNAFIPMAVDNMGTWSSRMIQYFDEAVDDFDRRLGLNPGRMLHETRVNVSIAACKVNALYLSFARFGREIGRAHV